MLASLHVPHQRSSHLEREELILSCVHDVANLSFGRKTKDNLEKAGRRVAILKGRPRHTGKAKPE